MRHQPPQSVLTDLWQVARNSFAGVAGLRGNQNRRRKPLQKTASVRWPARE